MVGHHKAGSIITELTNRSNVHYIAQSLLQEPRRGFPSEKKTLALIASDFSVSPAFASGLTCSLSFCDNLMINQFFNPMIKRILHEFISAAWKSVRWLQSKSVWALTVFDRMASFWKTRLRKIRVIRPTKRFNGARCTLPKPRNISWVDVLLRCFTGFCCRKECSFWGFFGT